MRSSILVGAAMLTILFPGLAAAQYQNQEVVPMTGYLPGPLGTKKTETDYSWFYGWPALSTPGVPLEKDAVPKSAAREFIDVSGGITAVPGSFVGKPGHVMPLAVACQRADWMLSSILPCRTPVSSAVVYQNACNLFVTCLDADAE